MKLFLLCILGIASVGCSGDRALSPQGPFEMSASVKLKGPSGWSHFATGSIPITVTKGPKRSTVAATYLSRLQNALRPIPRPTGSLSPTNQFELTTPAAGRVSNMSSSDPEAVADQFAQDNYVADDYSDTYIDQTAWASLYGGTITQDISGDGTVIATVRLDPISTTNPSGSVHLLLNGVLVATVNPRYSATSGGYSTYDEIGKTYSYYSGQQTSGDSVHYGPQNPAYTLFDRAGTAQFATLLPSYFAKIAGYVGSAVLPATANAQTCHECAPYVPDGRTDPCAAEARRVAISIIGLFGSAYRGNSWGIVMSTVSTVNSLHDYGRCAGGNSSYKQQQPNTT